MQNDLDIQQMLESMSPEDHIAAIEWHRALVKLHKTIEDHSPGARQGYIPNAVLMAMEELHGAEANVPETLRGRILGYWQ
jgi:hypothetical protein